MAERRESLPPVSSMINLDDFEKTAEHVLGTKSQAYAYYSSAADDEDGEHISLQTNLI